MTHEVEQEILESVRAGMPIARICELLEISETTITKHCRKHPKFSAQYKRAKLVKERTMLKMMESDPKKFPPLSWKLGKMASHAYGRKVDEQPVQLVPVRIETETVERASRKSQEAPAQQQAE